MEKLSILFYMGKPFKKKEKSIKIFEKTMKLNDTNCIYNIARLFLYGKNGIEKDVEKAIQLLIERISNNKLPRRFSIAEPKLIVRQSTTCIL